MSKRWQNASQQHFFKNFNVSEIEKLRETLPAIQQKNRFNVAVITYAYRKQPNERNLLDMQHNKYLNFNVSVTSFIFLFPFFCLNVFKQMTQWGSIIVKQECVGKPAPQWMN